MTPEATGMEPIEGLHVRTAMVRHDGEVVFARYPVSFVGEYIGTYRPTGTIDGAVQRLFRVEDGRLIVYVYQVGNGEAPYPEYFEEVTEEDLQPGGKFSDLGECCGLVGALSLDMALQVGRVEYARVAKTELLSRLLLQPREGVPHG